jgi:F0F1-type ATP synthase membrane subunit b/b'
LDLPLLVLPPLPESRNELEAYLRWLCNAMDQIGRVRESAKQKLEEIKETSKLQQEREVRRKLEAEVR